MDFGAAAYQDLAAGEDRARRGHRGRNDRRARVGPPQSRGLQEGIRKLNFRFIVVHSAGKHFNHVVSQVCLLKPTWFLSVLKVDLS